MNRAIVDISRKAAAGIQNGSLWIFANEFLTPMKSLEPGAWVDFKSEGRFIGTGYVNPHSLIAGRVVSKSAEDPGPEFFARQIGKSLKKRERYFDSGSFRAVFSEGDDLPGLIVDFYGTLKSPIVAFQITTAGMEAVKGDLITALKTVFQPESLVLRADSSVRRLEGLTEYVEIIVGVEGKLKNGQVREDDVLFAADFVGGQKTGFFLDQKENRRHLGAGVKGKRGLDLCCYSGGWGLTALAGGAEHVTFVDQSESALGLVERALALNRIDPSRATLAASDVFEFLESCAEKFDFVVADPPAFVKSKKNIPQATRAYLKLNTLALSKLEEGGILYSCSCSYHMNDQDFESVLVESLRKAGRVGTVLHRGLQALDHPWILNRPETKYLKCLAIRVSS